MARKKIVTEMESTKKNELNLLGDLIDSFGKNNDSFKALKKIVDKENADIKKLMLENIIADENNSRVYKTDDYIATLSIQDRSTMNEEKLIEWLKKNKFEKGIVKKKEYVDSEALEKAIYNEVIPADKVGDMDVCKEPKDVQVLTVKKKKEDK